MSLVAIPEALRTAGADLAGMGLTVKKANEMAAAPTSALLAPGNDEISRMIAAIFGACGRQYQITGALAALFNAQFVETLTVAGQTYAGAEVANVSSLQGLSI